jgi:hypothetical protein
MPVNRAAGLALALSLMACGTPADSGTRPAGNDGGAAPASGLGDSGAGGDGSHVGLRHDDAQSDVAQAEVGDAQMRDSRVSEGPVRDGSVGDADVGTFDGPADASESGVQCGVSGPTSFPTFNKSCTNDSDCAPVTHFLGCCGATLIMAISTGAVPAFNAAESLCASQRPRCACQSNAVSVEDGVMYNGLPGQPSPVAALCVNGRCTAKYTGSTFVCGDKTCATDAGYCSETTAGDASAPTFQCELTGGGVTCANLNFPGCTCTENQGEVFVTCT